MIPSIQSHLIHKYKEGEWTQTQDDLSIEEPLEISLILDNGTQKSKHNISITMRTPGDDKNLACGFLFTEGILQNPTDIHKTASLHENEISVLLKPHVSPNLKKLERHFYTSSSCGVCGKASIDAIHTLQPKQAVNTFGQVDAAVLFTLNDQVKQQQAQFKSTGGIHASALFDQMGNILHIHEDVGRHNALDKLIGAAFLNQMLPLDKHILFLSGRASFELIQKAAMAGIQCICALGAPSSLAVSLAQSFNITLVGFLKSSGFNVYGSPERIKS